MLEQIQEAQRLCSMFERDNVELAVNMRIATALERLADAVNGKNFYGVQDFAAAMQSGFDLNGGKNNG